jgi:hypothetical protein
MLNRHYHSIPRKFAILQQGAVVSRLVNAKIFTGRMPGMLEYRLKGRASSV